MSKHLGEKCGKRVDGDPDRRRVGRRESDRRTETRTDINTSRLNSQILFSISTHLLPNLKKIKSVKLRIKFLSP